ncbi:glycosyltransferase family 9 protein [Rhodanobacter sp. B2A1Ga4]|nr:glycosyltransferase family 9 protein [Rhodanobacter sp. B2A1Ga4]MBQ4854429.1 glycosyltransferase family 9 protein [Rhodanobacter sp. B2A1Ga4]
MTDVAELPQAGQPHTHIVARRRDVLRHRAIALFFGRLFALTGRQLCEPGQLPTRGVHRVLICRPNHRLGNTVLISPLLAEVEALYPGAEIDLVSGGDAARDLFTNRFQVRRIFSLPRKMARHPWLTVTLLRQLRLHSYDLAIDACNGSQSGRLLLAMVRARFKIGFPDAGANRTSAWHDLTSPEHLAHRSVFLLRTAYAGRVDRECFSLNLRLSDGEKQQAGQALAAILGASQQPPARRRVVGIFANATGAKRYGEGWWKQFVDALLTLQPDVLIVDVVAEHGQTQLGGEFASYYTRDLRRLASMIANLDGFISADCGVMHLAVASGTPTLGLFSVTSSTKYAPYGHANKAVDTHDMSSAAVAKIASDWLDLTGSSVSPALPVTAGHS